MDPVSVQAPSSNRPVQIDLGSSEIHKEGRRVPLQEQPLRVLALPVERPGEVVTREELQSALWPADTDVGFNKGLNTVIRELRIASGDSPENPRVIETIPAGDIVSWPRPRSGRGSFSGPRDCRNCQTGVSTAAGWPRQKDPPGGLGVLAAAVFVVAAGATYFITRGRGRTRRPHASDAGDPAFRESVQ